MEIAYIFPGAGIPSYRGLKHFYEGHIMLLKPRLQEASDSVGIDFYKSINDGISDLSGLKSQLFFYAFSGAMLDMLHHVGRTPTYVTGYSMGMFSSLFAAGAINFSDGLKMLQELNTLVFKTCQNKAYSMVAVTGLTKKEIYSYLKDTNKAIKVINQNFIHSFILSGPSIEIDKFINMVEKNGALTSKLPISLPYHTEILSVTEEEWNSLLNRYSFYEPQIPIVCSASQKIISDKEGCRKIALSNIYFSFSWLKTIKRLKKLGIVQFVECGPSITLSKIGKFIDAKHEYHNVKTLSLRRP